MNVEIVTTPTRISENESGFELPRDDGLHADTIEIESLPPTILSSLKDLPNLCSLAGLACTVLAIYCSIIGIFHAAMGSKLY